MRYSGGRPLHRRQDRQLLCSNVTPRFGNHCRTRRDLWGRHMSCLRAAVSRAALVAAAISLWAPVPLLAASFTVTSGTTDTTAKTVTGTDTGTVQGGGTLNVTGTAIEWSGPSPAPGVVINNFGTISATVRALDTSGGSTVRNFTLNNNAGALITSVNDAFRINSDVGTSTIAINNSGTIVSTGGGQGLNFNAIASTAANVTITNFASGVIRGEANDAIRPGQGALVTNFGLITSNGTFDGVVVAADVADESAVGGDQPEVRDHRQQDRRNDFR